jgi:hypothetical protein
MREDILEMLPAARLKKSALQGDRLLCPVCGPLHGGTTVYVGNEGVRVCRACHERTKPLTQHPEPAQPYCSEPGCTNPAGDNLCKTCGQRWCTKHTFISGHKGWCLRCAEEGTGKKVSRASEGLCDWHECDAFGMHECESCKRRFCMQHMSRNDGVLVGTLCKYCAGDLDDDEQENEDDTVFPGGCC